MTKYFLFLVATVFCAACAHTSMDEQLDKKVANESNIQTREDLRKEAEQDILAKKNLTEKQKKDLEELRKDINQNDNSVWQQTLKLRAVLIKEMLADNYSENQVLLIQKRLKKLEDQRLNAQFKAIERAKKILGHGFEDVEFINGLFSPDSGRF